MCVCVQIATYFYSSAWLGWSARLCSVAASLSGHWSLMWCSTTASYRGCCQRWSRTTCWTTTSETATMNSRWISGLFSGIISTYVFQHCLHVRHTGRGKGGPYFRSSVRGVLISLTLGLSSVQAGSRKSLQRNCLGFFEEKMYKKAEST